jgi:hypothetical protein
MATDDLVSPLADRLAVSDVVVRYFELVDAKSWDLMDEVFTDDTTAQWTPEVVVTGRDKLVDATRHMLSSDEIATYHHVATMAPRVDGDRASVVARVRAMHYGRGRREGKFYESLGVQPTELVRTSQGWRISHHEWKIATKFGDMEELFAPEIAAGKKH